ncbi:MAG TPA: DUF2785 domain-containing protein [Ktedonobacterales bacterium]|nr:DUF2785 domain-containing protein [Ktedonobacterales bacterium]
MDKAFWQAIIEADFTVPDGHTARDLTPELLTYLGATDITLRDTITYPVLATWLDRGLYADDEKRNLLARLAENLMHGIGENGTDSVFLRSFSVLMLAELVHEDNQRPWLGEQEARQLLELALVYLEAERDLRGWVPDKGWAHSPAHTADLLWALARNRFLAADDLQRILSAIRAKALTPEALPFLYDEDERLAQPVVAAMRRGLIEQSFLAEWVAGFVNRSDQPSWEDAFLAGEDYIPRHNAKLVLRSLYGQLTGSQTPPAGTVEFLPHLVAALESFSQWYRRA